MVHPVLFFLLLFFRGTRNSWQNKCQDAMELSRFLCLWQLCDVIFYRHRSNVHFLAYTVNTWKQKQCLKWMRHKRAICFTICQLYLHRSFAEIFITTRQFYDVIWNDHIKVYEREQWGRELMWGFTQVWLLEVLTAVKMSVVVFWGCDVV
jgi:hypothetical protein